MCIHILLFEEKCFARKASNMFSFDCCASKLCRDVLIVPVKIKPPSLVSLLLGQIVATIHQSLVYTFLFSPLSILWKGLINRIWLLSQCKLYRVCLGVCFFFFFLVYFLEFFGGRSLSLSLSLSKPPPCWMIPTQYLTKINTEFYYYLMITYQIKKKIIPLEKAALMYIVHN